MDSRNVKIFVLGWYNRGNLGDEAFKTSFKTLWPKIKFDFGFTLPEQVKDYDGIWIGGGSLFDNWKLNLENVEIPYAIIGTSIHAPPTGKLKHIFEKAKLVVVRDHNSKKLLPSSIKSPDLVFCQEPKFSLDEKSSPTKRIVILLNEFIDSKQDSQEWQSLAFCWFRREFAKVCDTLVEQGYSLRFLPMCINDNIDDRRLAGTILGKMNMSDRSYWELNQITESQLRIEIKNSDLVISQRLHGLIFAAQAGKPIIAISAHDKLNYMAQELDCGKLNYYGFSYVDFFREFERIFTTIESNKLYQYCVNARKEWLCISDIVDKTFFL